MKKINIKKYVSTGILLATMTTAFAVAIPAFADTQSGSTPTATAQTGEWKNTMMGRRPLARPSVFGTVSAVNGNTITVSGRQGFGTTTPVSTFTVDATHAKVTKNNTAGTVASITVGDTVLVSGTVTGSSVTATMIRDGALPTPGYGMGMGGGRLKMGQPGNKASSTPAFVDDGQPVVAGTVASISGATLSITNKSNVTYTVNAGTAKIVQGQSANATLANVTVGDNIIVQGAVNGTTITATTIVDQKKPTTTTDSTTGVAVHKGFLGQIGGFFMHIFGF